MDKSKFHKQVIGPFTGVTFTIRRVRLADYIRVIGVVPLEVQASIADQLRVMSESLTAANSKQDPELETKTLSFFLTKGLVATAESPAFWPGDEKECPDDAVCLADLGSDADFLSAQIAQFSFDLPGLRQLGSFFPGAGAGDSGPGGPAVRPETLSLDTVDSNGGDGAAVL